MSDQPNAASADLNAVAALAEPTRRRVYEVVVGARRGLTRDEVAETVGLPRNTVAVHLDRLTEEGLLTATFERRTGRSGPGAGRPAKIYERATQDVAVSLPPRHCGTRRRCEPATPEIVSGSA